MVRSRQFIRIGAMVSLLAVAAHGNAPTAEALKGIRALVFSGESLREPIRVHNSEYATSVWLHLRAGSVLPQDSLAILSGRRCVVISAFIFNDRNQTVPVEELPAGRGDYTYRMYLFGPGERPIMLSRDRFWKMNPEVTQDLKSLGVPIVDTTRTATGC